MKAVRRDPYEKVSDEEMRLAKLWFAEDGMEPLEIASLLRRDKLTMARLLVLKKERKKDVRPKSLDDASVDKLVALLDYMVVVPDAAAPATRKTHTRNLLPLVRETFFRQSRKL